VTLAYARVHAAERQSRYAAGWRLSMEQGEYKVLQADPRVFRRGEIALTIRLVGDELPDVARAFTELLEGPALDKPLQHSGGVETDLFRVELSEAEAEDICGHLLSKEAAAASPSGETTALASTIASLVDRWSRYVEAVAR
jgi:hypothetical protein